MPKSLAISESVRNKIATMRKSNVIQIRITPLLLNKSGRSLFFKTPLTYMKEGFYSYLFEI